MTLLLVDDEVYIVRAIMQSIDWKAIGVDRVLSAFNVEKAREIFSTETVDILLTDIEMPGQNGLDLARWAIAAGYDPVRLCLTCHAEFEYAQEAIALGFSDFYVKPLDFAELSTRLHTVVEELRHRAESERERVQGHLWRENRELVQNSFWRDIALGALPHDAAAILDAAETRQVAYNLEETYTAVLLQVRRPEQVRKQWQGYELLDYALRNIAAETLEALPAQQIISQSEGLLFVLGAAQRASLLPQLEDYIEACTGALGISLAAHVSEAVYGEDLHTVVKTLTEQARLNVGRGELLSHGEAKEEPGIPDLGESPGAMLGLLEGEQYEAFLSAALPVLGAVKNRTQLYAVMLVLLQLLGVQLAKQGQWLSVLAEETEGERLVDAYESVEAAEHWLRNVMDTLARLRAQSREEYVVVQKAKQYINENLNAKLPRAKIAAAAHVSPDYLTRLFKRVEGTSLVQYIIDTKMRGAAELLKVGDETIGEIAGRLGYDNFSYFSNLFKKSMGSSPREFKHECQKNDANRKARTEN